MDAINLTLNLTGLLLWLNWRSSTFIPHSPSALSLLSTLKRAEPRLHLSSLYLLALIGLLCLRSLFYWQIGPGVDWTPVLDLAALVIPFRSDRLSLMVIFSLLSFTLMLLAFYAWLLLISVINRRSNDADPYEKLARLNLGWFDHLPSAAKLLLPSAVTFLLWVGANPGLVRLGLIPAPDSLSHICQQAIVLAAASLLFWKFFFFGLLLIYIVSSYVYLGHFAFLDFVNTTARNALRVFAGLPLQIGRIDLSPVLLLFSVEIISLLLTRFLPIVYRHLPF